MSKILFTVKMRPWLGEGEGDGGTPPNPNPNPNPSPAPAGQPITFATQADFDKEINRRINTATSATRQSWQAKNQELVTQLEELKNQKNMTQEQRDQLEQQIDQLKSTFTTETQQKEAALANLQKKYDSDTKKKDAEVAAWRQRYEEKSFAVDVAVAAEEHKAFKTEQIQAILSPYKVFEEGVDGEGKPNGVYTPMVKDFPALDSEGKPIFLKLTIKDAVKKMTEMPDQYGNLFRGEGHSGLEQHPGQGSGGSGGRIGNLDNLTVEQYKAQRGKIREQMAKNGDSQ